MITLIRVIILLTGFIISIVFFIPNTLLRILSNYNLSLSFVPEFFRKIDQKLINKKSNKVGYSKMKYTQGKLFQE